MRKLITALCVLVATSVVARGQALPSQPALTRQQTYTLVRVSSSDPTGRNADARTVAPGATFTVLDADGPAMITHIWFTIADDEPYNLKRIVLRIYWDNEKTPSVETPIVVFFGVGLGEYHEWQSQYLSVGSIKALNCFFPMPFARHARITVTNEGQHAIDSLYYNIDYQKYSHPLPPGTIYFHAEYRQAQPNHGWSNKSTNNGESLVNDKVNLDGKDNFVRDW